MAGKLMIPKVISVTPNEGATSITPDRAFGRIECGFEKKSPEIVYDFGKKVTGYLELKVGQNSGDTFVLRYGPTRDCLHMKEKIRMPADGYFLSEFYYACRYIAVSVESESIQANPVFADIEALSLISSQYPVVYAGSFTSGDADLDTAWRRGAYTIELCMQKYKESCRFRMKDFDRTIGAFSAQWKGPFGDYVLMDGPRRDREAWLGDIRAEALGAYTAFASYDVCKNSLALFCDLQRRDGTTVGSGSTWQNFIEYNYWGIIAFWESYLYSGDRAFLEKCLPVIRNVIAFTESRLNEDGFISNDASWMWTIPREGYNAGTQAILSYALVCAAKAERAFHFDREAERLERLSERIRDSINRIFWNEERGVYEERLRITADRMPVLLDINCYCIDFGIADREKAGRILDYLRKHMWTEYGSATMDCEITGAEPDPDITCYPLTHLIKQAKDPKAEMYKFMWGHNRTVWPFMNAYEVQARFLSGDTDGAVELIRRCWCHPYFDETDTFWEMVHPKNPVFNSGTMYYIPKDDCYNSAAHGWSGWVGYLMQTYMLGVSPVTPGFGKTRIAPHLGSLETLSGEVPTPEGSIDVTVRKTSTVYTVRVSAPACIDISVDIDREELGNRRPEIVIAGR